MTIGGLSKLAMDQPINSISLSQVNPVAEDKARKPLPFHPPPRPPLQIKNFEVS